MVRSADTLHQDRTPGLFMTTDLCFIGRSVAQTSKVCLFFDIVDAKVALAEENRISVSIWDTLSNEINKFLQNLALFYLFH